MKTDAIFRLLGQNYPYHVRLRANTDVLDKKSEFFYNFLSNCIFLETGFLGDKN